MTFYEAAVDVLSKEGKPLHYEEITRRAMEEGLLSHVGNVPADIMRARLTAMSRRDEGRHLAVVEPGVFGLADWGIVQDPEALEATEPAPREKEAALRPNERTPMTLAEKRAAREAERAGRFETEDKEARAKSRRRRRRPRKGETAGDALAALVTEVGGGPVDLQYVLDALPNQSTLPEGFPEDLEGLRSLALAENEALEAAGQPPRYKLDGDRIAIEPKPPAKEAKAARKGEPAPAPAPRGVGYEAAAPALLQAFRALPREKLEELLLELASRHSFTDAKVAKRSAKGSPLFTGMVRFGVAQLRVAVRMLLSGRDLRVDDVDELRADLENYSAGAGVLLGLGKIPRAARNRAEDMSQKPVLLFDGESLALACVKSGIGVRSRVEEVIEVLPSLVQPEERKN